jgi:hypothetical protein
MKKNKPQMDTDKNKSEIKPRVTPAPNHRYGAGTGEHSAKKKPVNPVKKIKIDDIANDFGDRLLKGESISIEDILKQYPNIQEKLKPHLEAELALFLYGQEVRKQMAEHKEQLWQKLEKKILEKQKKQIQERVRLVESKETLPIKLRAEFIPILLYVKGKTHRIGEGIHGITRFIKLLFLLDKETDLGKLVSPFYEFVPYKIGPFEPAIYQDLKVLELAGIVKKETYSYSIPTDEKQIDEGFNQNGVSTLYTLTDEGMIYAKALIDWLDKKDPEIAIKLRTYKTYYAQVPLKKLLDYIYQKYPEYTTESEIIKKIIK